MSGLSKMATATYSTKRSPSQSGGSVGAAVEHLTGVNCLPIMPLVVGQGASDKPSHPKQSLSGRIKDYWITSAESQSHVDGGVTVDQVPDIIEGDVLVVGSVEYKVRDIDNWPATSTMLAFVYLTIEESR